jgi:hypothetical protein
MPPYVNSEKNVAGSANLSWSGQLAALAEQHPTADDRHLAAMYICLWSLASGRRLRDDVPPEQLSEDELIAFWADDLGPPPVRHVIGAWSEIRQAA